VQSTRAVRSEKRGHTPGRRVLQGALSYSGPGTAEETCVRAGGGRQRGEDDQRRKRGGEANENGKQIEEAVTATEKGVAVEILEEERAGAGKRGAV